MRLRRGTTTQLTTGNKVFALGEVVVEVGPDGHVVGGKWGDNVTHYNDLPYIGGGPGAISDIPGLEDALAAAVHTTGAETVGGVKTFNTSPLVPDARKPGQVVNKAQMDAAIANTPLGWCQSELGHGTYAGFETEAKIREVLQGITDAGGTQVRIAAWWKIIEPVKDAGYVWTGMDRFFTVLQEFPEIEPLVCVTGGAALVPTGATVADFGQLCGALAARYGANGGTDQCHHWEIWNEANHRSFAEPFTSGGTPFGAVGYTQLLISASNAIRTADPTAFIVSVGLMSTVDFGANDISPSTFLQGMYDNNARGYFDAIGMHWYSGAVDFSTFLEPSTAGAHYQNILACRAIAIAAGAADEYHEYANLAAFPVTGVADRIYVAVDSGLLYRWTGSTYTMIGGGTLDPELSAIAGLTSAANKGIQFTGSGTAATFDLTIAGKALLDDADAGAQRATLGVSTSYATIATLKATTVADSMVRVLGYYSAWDGGGGLFAWDSSDTTSTDNGGTIITPTSGLSSSGRWKRVYEGELNARWFGVNPSQSDNTAALQKAVTWVASRTYPDNGGVVFIPEGWYEFRFGGGGSGLSTITINADNVLIRGEGKATRLMVTNRARPNQVGYFFTFSQGGNLRGQGGGVVDVNFYGNSMLKWCIYLGTWRDAEFGNISAFDVHSGILDGEVTSTTLYGESILVYHLDSGTSAGSSATQYGVRFRAGVGASQKTWSDCWIENSDIISCWDSGVLLEDVQRFRVRGIVAANNGTVSDTVDGTSKSGCLHTVRITCGANATIGATGGHEIDGIYLESQSGSETVATNVAVQIDVPLGISNQTRYSRISNIVVNGTCGLVKFVDGNGFDRANNNEFVNRIVTSITSSATPSINVNEVRQLNITALAAAITSMTSGLSGTPMDGDELIVRFKDDGTARAITWGAKFSGVLASTTVVGQTVMQRLRWNEVAAAWVGYYASGAGETLLNPTITNYTESVVAIGNTSTAKTIALTNGTVQTATLTGNCTFTMPTPTAGKSFTLLLNTGAGSFTAAFTGVKWPASSAPTATVTAARLDLFTFIADGTNWYGSVAQNYTP